MNAGPNRGGPADQTVEQSDRARSLLDACPHVGVQLMHCVHPVRARSSHCHPAPAFLLAVSLLVLLVLPLASPVAAQGSKPPTLAGGYYGSFATGNGDFMTGGLTVSVQQGHQVWGWVQFNAPYPDLPVYGTVNPAGHLHLAGHAHAPLGPVHITLNLHYQLGEDGQSSTLTGEYALTGPGGQRGQTTLQGWIPK